VQKSSQSSSPSPYNTNYYPPSSDYYTGIGLDGKPFTYSADPNSPYYVSNFDTQTVTLYQGSPAAIPASSFTSSSQAKSVDAIPEPTMLGLFSIAAAAGLLRRRRGAASSPLR
jgi:hypothetical protein